VVLYELKAGRMDEPATKKTLKLSIRQSTGKLAGVRFFGIPIKSISDKLMENFQLPK
jgi:hypothetical protein